MKKIKTAVKILFILIAFFIIFNKINISEFKQITLKNPLLLLAAFILFNISQAVSALRVHKYLREINIAPEFKHQLMLYYTGMFYNTLLPGGIGGDAYKAYFFQKHFSSGYKSIIKALLIDRISGLFAILTLIGALILFSSFKGFFIYIAFLILIAPFALYFFHRYLFKEFLHPVWHNFIISLIIQVLQGIAFLCIVLSLGEYSHLSDYVLLFFISSVISVIPVSVGGIGLRELTFLWGLEYLHIAPETGILSAFLFFVITVISASLGALFIKKTDTYIFQKRG